MPITNKNYKCEKCGDISIINGTNHHGSFRGCEKCGDKRVYRVCQTKEGLELWSKQSIEKAKLRNSLPKSILSTEKQIKTFTKNIMVDGQKGLIECNINWDDDCCNNHNSLGITGVIYSSRTSKADRYWDSCGCIHDEIIKYFPDFKHLTEWHGFTSDGYLYLSNITYHAKNGDIEAARSCANWKDATLEQLLSEQLLKDRLPQLMEQMKKDIEALGFIY